MHTWRQKLHPWWKEGHCTVQDAVRKAKNSHDDFWAFKLIEYRLVLTEGHNL